MIDPRSRRALSILVVMVFAVLGTATAGGGDQSAAGGGSSAQVSAMEEHFTSGQIWGEGPDATEMAQTIMAELEPGDAVAVRDIPGAPRRVVALIKYGDAAAEGLSDLDDATRREHLDALLSILDSAFELGDATVAVGIRGTLFYGAVVTRQPAAVPQYETGVRVGPETLEAVLAVPTTVAAPPAAITIGQQVAGTCAAPPMPTPRYLLTLAAEANVVTTVVSPGLGPEQSPFAVVCRGDLPIRRCQDDQTIVSPDLDESGNVVYRLPQGTYSIFMIGADDCAGAIPCPALTAPYQLTLTQSL